jgi:alpha(1,3/1,4) fucosyltransferase
MKTIRVSFKKFWYDFNNNDNIFLFLLRKKYNVIIDNINPEYIFTGDKNDINKNSINIWFSAEPNWDKNNCDWGLVQYFIKDKSNYIRFPLYLYYIYDFIKKDVIKDFDFFFQQRKFTKEDLKQKTNFCTFICSGPINGVGQYRDFFVKKLMNYKKVDCPGTRFNNIQRLPGSSDNGLLASDYKRNFIKNYKFTFGFENTTTKDGYIGYTTEKLIEPMVCNTIPLYWGNVLIHAEFNTNSFINYHDYRHDEDVINKIIEIDNNDNLYIEMMNQPYTYNNDYLKIDYLISLLEKIII